jgi:hypothetical protein
MGDSRVPGLTNCGTVNSRIHPDRMELQKKTEHNSRIHKLKLKKIIQITPARYLNNARFELVLPDRTTARNTKRNR